MSFLSNLSNMNLLDILLAVLDISIVAYVIYRLLLIIKDTKAIQLVKGIGILMVLFVVSGWLNLYTVNWLLDKTWSVIIVGIVVVFQPEIRRGLEQLGRSSIFSFSVEYLNDEELNHIIDESIKMLIKSSRARTGVLLVFQRQTGLMDFIETGTKMDSLISHELLENIFINKSPLHDGAVIVKGSRIAAAGAILPLTDSHDISSALGTRHRAAVGISEVSDAIAIVVSEETGHISLANDGNLLENLDDRVLEELLRQMLLSRSNKKRDSLLKFSKWRSKE